MLALIKRFYIIHYAGTLIKFIWAFITPVILTTAIAFIFNTVFKIEGQKTVLIIASGYIFWQFISSSISKGHRQLIENRTFFKQLTHHRSQFLFSFLIFNFLINLPGMLIITILCWTLSTFSFLQIIILMIGMILIIVMLSGFIYLLAPWTVFYPDISHGIDTILLLLLWISPVFYPSSDLPDNLAWMAKYNPFSWGIDIIRYALGLPVYMKPFYAIFFLSCFALFIFCFGFFYYKKHSQEIVKFL